MTPEEIAAAAAAKAAADKVAADAAAAADAEKAAADKAAADAAAEEAARIEAEKNMTEAEKEKQKLIREVMDKKNKLKDETAEKERLAAELKKFEGIDLNKVKTLLDAEKTREKEELERKGEWERLKTMMAEEAATEKKTLENRIAELTGSLSTRDSTINELTVGQNFTGSTFIREDLVLTPAKARQIYGAHFEMQDGKTVAFDKPVGAAGRTMYVGADGQPLAFDVAMKKIIEADPEKDSLLKVKMKAGSGSNSQQVHKTGDTSGLEGLSGSARITALLNRRKAK